MAETDRERYQRRKADPAKYAAYLAQKREYRASRRAAETERKRLWRMNNPEHAQLIRQANHAVEMAIQQGLLQRPRFCSRCGSTSAIQSHHRSYEREHWLAVIWLCQTCHSLEHFPQEVAG